MWVSVCSVCGKPAENTCRLCGRLVCKACYDISGMCVMCRHTRK